MFIRKKVSPGSHPGSTYIYYQLIESYNSEQGPRNRVLAHLGKLDITPAEQKILSTIIDNQAKGFTRTVRYSDKIEQLAEQIYLKYIQNCGQPQLEGVFEDRHPVEEYSFTRESLDTGYHRSVGLEILALHYWKALKFEQILKDCGFSLGQVELAQVAIFGRLISPGSERHTVYWFNHQSGLSDFLKEVKAGLRKDRLYRVGDKILEHKAEIEASLRHNVKTLHSLIDRVYLYDLTNTYFEGNQLKSQLCKRGKSKERRDDCPLVTLALVVDQDGFPVFSKIYSGNQAEPPTLREVLAELKDSEDLIDRVSTPAIVMDRGIATQENLSWLEQEGYHYFVIERRNEVKEFTEEFSTLAGFTESYDQHKGRLYLKKLERDNRTKVLVYSEAKAEKERSMTTRREKNLLEEVSRLNQSIEKGYISKADKVLIRIGRLKEKYGSIASNYGFSLKYSRSNPERVESIELIDLHHRPPKSEFPGCYVIETNYQGFTAKEIWKFYMQLSEVESAFCSMKTDLGTRPIHHQKDSRIETHLFYSVLAYTILKSITHQLALQEFPTSWTRIKQILKTHMRSTTMFTTPDGYRVHIRQTSQPEGEAQKIYSLLKVRIFKNQVIKKFKV